MLDDTQWINTLPSFSSSQNNVTHPLVLPIQTNISSQQIPTIIPPISTNSQVMQCSSTAALGQPIQNITHKQAETTTPLTDSVAYFSKMFSFPKL